MKNAIRLLLLTVFTCLLWSCDRNDPDFKITQNGIALKTYRNDKGELVIDEKESACFSRKYQYSIDRIGTLGDDKDVDLEECNGMIGYSPDNYKKVVEFQERVRVKIKEELGDKIDEIYKKIEIEGDL